jgi:hypothetical protein
VPIDERARELAGLTVSSVQRRSNGWYVFASRLDRPPSGPDDIVGRHTTVLVGDPDGIDLAVDWQGQGDTCVADGRVYQLTRQLPEGEPAIPLDADAVVSLHTLPLSGGPEVPVKLPPVSTAFGGQNVTLGCDPSGPFLATAQGDPTAPQTAVYQLVNDAWTERTDLVPRDAVRPEPPISDYRGVLIPWQVGKMELERESTAVVDDTDAAFVRNDVAPGQFWRGSTGDRITVVRPSEADPGQSGLLMTEFWS